MVLDLVEVVEEKDEVGEEEEGVDGRENRATPTKEYFCLVCQSDFASDSADEVWVECKNFPSGHMRNVFLVIVVILCVSTAFRMLPVTIFPEFCYN